MRTVLGLDIALKACLHGKISSYLVYCPQHEVYSHKRTLCSNVAVLSKGLIQEEMLVFD